MKQLLGEMSGGGTHGADQQRFKSVPSCMIHSDNRSAMQIASHDTNHGKSKHIDIRLHFVRDDIKAGEYGIKWVASVTIQLMCSPSRWDQSRSTMHVASLPGAVDSIQC